MPDFEIKQSTIVSYNKLLNRLKKDGIHLDTVSNINTIIDNLKNRGLKNPTIKNYLNAFIWHKRKSKNPDDKFIAKISQKISSINKSLVEKTESGVLTEREKKNMMHWDKIFKIYEKVKENKNNSNKSYLNFVLLTMYILFPPRRMQDYTHMYIYSDKYDKNDISKNYYFPKTGKILFNKYKTSRKFKQQIFKLSTKHNKILINYIKKFKKTGKLFNMMEQAARRRLYSIFSLYTSDKKQRVGSTVLRHSYVSFATNAGLIDIPRKKRLLSEKMAHDVTTQMMYYKQF